MTLECTHNSEYLKKKEKDHHRFSPSPPRLEEATGLCRTLRKGKRRRAPRVRESRRPHGRQDQTNAERGHGCLASHCKAITSRTQSTFGDSLAFLCYFLNFIVGLFFVSYVFACYCLERRALFGHIFLPVYLIIL